MDVKRLFKGGEPREPLTSLRAIVNDWNWRFGDGGQFSKTRDQVVEYCRHAPNFAAAVQRACASRDAAGKMHNHQTRVRDTARKQFAGSILRQSVGCSYSSFDQLYDTIDRVKPWGIGDVTLYDVAVRIGAYLDLEPDSLYLHAGVYESWNKLHGGKAPLVLRVPRSNLPEEFAKLPANEIEDLLCTYRSVVENWLEIDDAKQT